MAIRPRRNTARNSRGRKQDNGAVGGSDGAQSETVAAADTGPAIIAPGEVTAGSAEPVAFTLTGAEADTGTISAGGEKRKRGRPPGSKNAGTINISGVEKLLLGIHTTLHAAFKAPELELGEDEAREMAKAYADVAACYPALQIPAEVTAIANLCGVVSIVYGSRISAYRMRMASERRQGRAAQPAKPFVPPTAPIPDNQMNGVEQPGPAKPVPQDVRKGVIAGIGEIEFPEDHPLMRGNKH